MFGTLADLTISLTASLIHIDNLILTVDPVNESYEEIWLANEQIGQALKSLIKLRELSIYEYDVRNKRVKPSAAELSHDLNECLTILQIFNDFMQHYNGDKQLYEIVNLTYNSVKKLIANYSNNKISKKPQPGKAKYLESIKNC